MDKYVEELFNQLHDLCHRIIGYLDAKADLKPNLRFVEDDEPKVLLFPNTKKNVSKENKTEQGFVEFTDEEIKQMPKKLQRLIIINKKRCRIREHVSGKNSTTYEIRFRSEGYNISASGKTKELAKANMLKKLLKAKPQVKENDIPTTFHSFATFYFETFRKDMVTPETFRTDLNRYKKHLQPYFKEKALSRITPADCKKLLDDIEEAGKGKTADELYSLMSIIFKSAIAHHLIDRNPLATVLKSCHEKESGEALTKEEESLLLAIKEPTFDVAFAIALYTGLRPNELKTAQIDGDFIIAVNSKRKRIGNSKARKIEYKRIPICKRLIPFLKNGIPKLPTAQLLRRRFKAILPTHKLYDLRTTFNTRCKELGVSDHARMHFMGHSLGALGNAYTDLSEEYLLKEGKKLNEW